MAATLCTYASTKKYKKHCTFFEDVLKNTSLQNSILSATSGTPRPMYPSYQYYISHENKMYDVHIIFLENQSSSSQGEEIWAKYLLYPDCFHLMLNVVQLCCTSTITPWSTK
jgi:hypothetical protein